MVAVVRPRDLAHDAFAGWRSVMEGPFDSSINEAARRPSGRRVGVRVGVAGILLLFPGLLSGWLGASILLHPGHPIANGCAVLHCGLGRNVIPLFLLAGLSWCGWRAVGAVLRWRLRRREASPNLSISRPPVRWRLLFWYGNCVAAIALLGLLVAISNSASTLSCSSSGLISPEIAGHIGKSTFSQAGWWLLFLVGSITGNWGASLIAGRRSSFSAVAATVAHLVVLLFLAIVVMASKGLLPR